MPPTLDRLSAGTLDWLGRNLDYFDPYSENARSSAHGKVKAALELALLCHCWTRLDPGDDRLNEPAALIRRLWPRPDFQRLIAAQPDFAPQYGLIYAALAPPGIDDRLCRATLARLAAEGFLSPLGKSPYQRLETRYYADKAGVDHGIEPYEELFEQSPLVKPPVAAPAPSGAPLATQDAYAVTHSSFFLSDFGRRSPGPAHALARAEEVTGRMLDHCVRRDRWDLTAELVMTWFCLGHDPLGTPSGVAAIECLTRAQRPDGAIPARSAELRAAGPLSAGESFRKAYHTTLVTALMSLMVTSVRP
ncbi:DUF6895 family protein [Actinoallomurus sp. CA-142502]|uniref:DUF6895 family protein n=1 Tax=Actinoallomurus sp. CA-142502 TaxID=3239885 RepID=UPI003D92A737